MMESRYTNRTIEQIIPMWGIWRAVYKFDDNSTEYEIPIVCWARARIGGDNCNQAVFGMVATKDSGAQLIFADTLPGFVRYEMT